MGWLIRGPWAVIKWIWAGIVLVGYVLWGILSIVTWFTADAEVYTNNPPRAPRNPPPDPEKDAEKGPARPQAQAAGDS
jgi:hypothetical protein